MMDYRAIRKATGLTQSEVGDILGFSKATISAFETGQHAVIAPRTIKLLHNHYKKVQRQNSEIDTGVICVPIIDELKDRVEVISGKVEKVHNQHMTTSNCVKELDAEYAKTVQDSGVLWKKVTALESKVTPIYQDFCTLQDAVSSQNKAIQALLTAPKHDAEDKAKEQAAFALLNADVNKLKGAVSNLQWTLVVETIFIVALAITTAWRLG